MYLFKGQHKGVVQFLSGACIRQRLRLHYKHRLSKNYLPEVQLCANYRMVIQGLYGARFNLGVRCSPALMYQSEKRYLSREKS